MAKKLGKIMLFTAAVASVATAVYYFMHKRESADDIADDEEEDGDDSDTASDSARNYVPLNTEDAQNQDAAPENAGENAGTEGAFTPLADQVAQASEESVEEFLDEEDSSDEEPAINADND